MASRNPRQFATAILRQIGRRDAAGLTICPLCQPRLRNPHSARTYRAPTTPVKSPPTTPPRSVFTARAAPLSLLVGGGLLASLVALYQLSEDSPSPHVAPPAPDNRDPSLPRFRLADVRKHDASSPEPWVTFEDKVYNITDWIAAHPGGDVILRAAGAGVEPYWNIFTIHKSQHVREILQQYLIGYIDAADLGPDGLPPAEAVEDPFVYDPARDPRLITHTEKPRNAEPPIEELDRTFRTPNELFYIRHHMWVPVVDQAKADEHLLTIELPDGDTKQYTLEDLKTRFPTHRVTAVLQCSGNRRNDMTRHAGKTNGLQWGVGAISNAEWEGVRLSDILADAGLKVRDPTTPTKMSALEDDRPDANALHVQFTGLEAYGASIPLAKALDPRGDVLLAFGMNGQTLPRDHGFPLRAVVPGHVAARSVKWLSKIVISDEESHSQWQRRDYKSFGPNEGANPDWDRALSIQEMPVTSAITGVWVGDCVRKGRVPWIGSKNADNTEADAPKPRTGGSRIVDMAAVSKNVGFTPEALTRPASKTEHAPSSSSSPCPIETPAEPIALQGYAYSGGGRAIARVDVSLDGGKTWDQADLVDDCAADGCHGNKAWAWKRWRYVGKLPVLSLPAGAVNTNTNAGPNTDPIGDKDVPTAHDGPPSRTQPNPNQKPTTEQQQQTHQGRRHQQPIKKHCTTLVVKATDDAYNTQPESHAGIYNVRGNLATAWHRVRICPRCTGGDEDSDGDGDGNGNGNVERSHGSKGSKGSRGLTWSTGETYGCGFRRGLGEEQKEKEKDGS